MEQFIYEDLTYKLRGIFFDVQNAIGYGYREKIYCQAICKSLNPNNLHFEYQVRVPVVFENESIANRYIDFIIEDKIVVEIKVGDRVPNSHFNQLKEYLNLTGYKLGLLVVFRKNEVKIFRIANLY